MARPLRHVCVLWPRLGPYHLARLKALHTRLAEEGVALTALETSRIDETYAWREETGATPYARAVALSGLGAESAAPVETRMAVTAALDLIDADAVAIPSYSTPDAQAALAWCRRHRRTAILMFDSRAEDAERTPWREAVKRALVRQYDAALVAGTPQTAYVVALGMPPSHVFTPVDVVDNDHFQDGADRARRSGNVPVPGPYLLSVNRFTARKNVGRLIEAYGSYRRRTRTPWPLVLLGDGPERARLERLAAQTEGVLFGGFQQIDSLPTWYGGAGAYVHPALADPWGLVVNEAMAAGLPVLVSTGAGCSLDLVEEGANGFLFEPYDSEALADRLVSLTAAPERHDRMGRRSREIIARYTPGTFADGLWSAVQAGHARSDRPLGVPARAVLAVLNRVATHHHAFHTVEA